MGAHKGAVGRVEFYGHLQNRFRHNFSVLVLSTLLFAIVMFIPSLAQSAPAGASASGGPKRPSVEELKYRYEMSLDLSVAYTRSTEAQSMSDTGARLNFGGMFTSWVGLDALALYGIKQKSYLVGGAVKLVPIDWLFVKAGAGGFGDRTKGEIRPTPILGAGLVGRFSEYYYVLVEGLYFQGVEARRNIGMNVGLGIVF